MLFMYLFSVSRSATPEETTQVKYLRKHTKVHSITGGNSEREYMFCIKGLLCWQRPPTLVYHQLPACWQCPHPRTTHQTATSEGPELHTGQSQSGFQFSCPCQSSAASAHSWYLWVENWKLKIQLKIYYLGNMTAKLKTMFITLTPRELQSG